MDEPSKADVSVVLGKLADNELIPILLALRYKINYREIGQLMRLPANEVASSIRTGLHLARCELNSLPLGGAKQFVVGGP